VSIVTKIQQGTGQLTGASLCLSCTHGSIRQDAKGEHRRCDVFRRDLSSDVRQCSEYYNSGLPKLSDMHAIAWTLVTDKTKKIGFKPPKKSDDASMPSDWWD